MCGASKGIGLHFHTPHVLFNGTILVRGLVFAFTTRCFCEVSTELLVWRMRRACNSIVAIGGWLRGRLLRFRASDDNKTTTLLFAVEDWPRQEGVLAS
jgi:hypothetical protein